MLSARTPAALDAATENLRKHLEKHQDESIADVAYTLQAGRRAFRHRRALACSEHTEALKLLAQPASNRVATGKASEQGAAPLDLDELVRSRAEAWSALLDEREVRLDVATDGDGPVVVRAAEARLEQVLDNLLSNALEVSPPGARIRVATRRNGARVESRSSAISETMGLVIISPFTEEGHHVDQACETVE